MPRIDARPYRRIARMAGAFEGKRGARARRREQALDRVGDRAGARRRGRAAGVHLSGRAHREERARARRDGRHRARDRVRRALRRRHRPRLRRGRRTRSAASSTSSCTRSRSRPPRISKAASPTRRATASGWRVDISAYSLVACARAAEPLMEARGGGSIVTMTYLGGERAVPHYNVMGVAKATLDASRALSRLGSRARRTSASTRSPPARCARSRPGRSPASRRWRRSSRSARRCTVTSTPTTSAPPPRYLLGDGAKNVTGTTLYVDSGYHAMGM